MKREGSKRFASGRTQASVHGVTLLDRASLASFGPIAFCEYSLGVFVSDFIFFICQLVLTMKNC